MTTPNNDEGIILIEEHSHSKALHFQKLPDSLQFQGQLFLLKQESVGEYDYLRNQTGALIGFSINITSRERKLLASLGTTCTDVSIGDTQVRFVLGDGFANEAGVQIPTTLYRNSAGRILIAFYQWEDFGKLGFTLHSGEERVVRDSDTAIKGGGDFAAPSRDEVSHKQAKRDQSVKSRQSGLT
jgi:hypothetical protein